LFFELKKDCLDDVQGALDSGMKAILVKTGKYQKNDEQKLSNPPQYIADDFPAAVDYILKQFVNKI
jgi:ribonucleotide monophosphatase NagD (HAD superfamily)